MYSCETKMSVIFNCGFARVAVKESFRKVGSASVETNLSLSIYSATAFTLKVTSQI